MRLPTYKPYGSLYVGLYIQMTCARRNLERSAYKIRRNRKLRVYTYWVGSNISVRVVVIALSF